MLRDERGPWLQCDRADRVGTCSHPRLVPEVIFVDGLVDACWSSGGLCAPDDVIPTWCAAWSGRGIRRVDPRCHDLAENNISAASRALRGIVAVRGAGARTRPSLPRAQLSMPSPHDGWLALLGEVEGMVTRRTASCQRLALGAIARTRSVLRHARPGSLAREAQLLRCLVAAVDARSVRPRRELLHGRNSSRASSRAARSRGE